MQGWIKLYRKLTDWEWYDDAVVKAVFIDLLILANHQDNTWHGQTVKRGSLVTSLVTIAGRNGLTIQQVRTALNKLEKTGGTKNVKNSVVISEEITCQTESVRPSIQLIVDAWNSLQKDTAIKPVSRIVTSSTRYKLLSARLKEYGIDNVLNAIENIRQSDFLKGNNDRGWIITFDWFVKPNNFPKVLEGNYCNTVGTVCNQTKRKSEYDEFMADLATIREECIRNGE